MSEPLTIRCPQCRTSYLLPRPLLGPSGARVKCPECGMGFVVTSREAAAAGPAPAPPAAAAAPADAGAVANELLEGLERRWGARLGEARARGRLLAELGPDLMGAFDEYRRRLGAGADGQVFRRVLRARLGVALDP
jgi:predicted Zn finger-like uncharacterized protein